MVVKTVLSQLRTNLTTIIIGCLIGVFGSVMTFALNVNNLSKTDLKNTLESKASIIYVDKAFELHRLHTYEEGERIRDMQLQITQIYELLLKDRK